MKAALVTVVEHAHYLKKAERLLSEQQIEGIASAVSADPEIGGGYARHRGLSKIQICRR